jgi:FtsH-binding integral membrane protein
MNSSLVAEVTKALASSVPATFAFFNSDDAAGGLAACGCMGFFGFIVIGVIALNIALLVWVAKDAKNRNMDSPVLWMILVVFTGFIGLIVYLLTRPKGELVTCPHCGNKRMQVSAKCPHCGNV